MFKHPLFEPWRRVWEHADGSVAVDLNAIDGLVARRSVGRVQAPDVTRNLLQRVLAPDCRALFRAELEDDQAQVVLRSLWPLVRAAAWPRWLMLEAALDDASTNGSLHLAALVLRTQVEELDALAPLGRLDAMLTDGRVDDRLFWECVDLLRIKVLPRLRGMDPQELIDSSNAAVVKTRPARLQHAFDALSDYVHPNYGSHVLALRPGSAEAARVLLDAFKAVYEAFFELPWAEDERRDAAVVVRQNSLPHPFEILARAVPSIVSGGRETGALTIEELVETFRRQVEVDAGVDEVAVQANAEPLTDGAAAMLLAVDPPVASWPSAIRTAGDRRRHDSLLRAESRMSAEATRVAAVRAGANGDDNAWLAVLRSAIEFAVAIAEFKLTMLGRDSARMITIRNVLGAALCVRAMLEHHAVAIELGEKLRNQWERLAKAQVAKDDKVADFLQQAEKQLSRTLASSSASTGATTPWYALWRESVRVYHVMDPVKALEAEEPGFLRTYGLLSHLIHGTSATGGDFLGVGGVEPTRQMLAQLMVFLYAVLRPDAAMDRIVAPALVAQRIEGWERTSGKSLGSRVDTGRVPGGQKLKPRRDVFGAGTREDPFRFREGLLYHENYARYLDELGVKEAVRLIHVLENGVADEVLTSDGRTIYFLNDKLNIGSPDDA